MVALRVTIEDEAVKAMLARLVAGGQDLAPVMDEIGGAMVASTQMRFEQGRGPGNVPWPPSIRALAEGGRTLVLSGRLVASITHAAGPSHVEWGSNVIYAAVHQLGAVIRAKSAPNLRFRLGDRWVSKPEVTIPARPFLGVDDEDWAEIRDIITDWLAGLGAGASA